MSNSVVFYIVMALVGLLVLYCDRRCGRVSREKLRQAERDAALRRQKAYEELLRGKGDPLQAKAARVTQELLHRIKA